MSRQGVGCEWPLAVGLMAMLAGTAPADGQLIRGRVMQDGSEQPVAAVTIELSDTSGLARATTVSDTAGNFRLLAPRPGTYHLRLSHVAYASVETQTIDAEVGREVELELRMSPTAVPLEPLRVVSRANYNAGWLQEYYDRAMITRRSGIGRVFFRDEVERAHAPYASTFLIYLMPRGNCRPTLFVDGLEIEDSRQLDAVMRPDILEGVELYNNAAFLPPRYQNRGHCAVALFWTRRDLEGARPFTWKRVFVAGGILSAILLLFQM